MPNGQPLVTTLDLIDKAVSSAALARSSCRFLEIDFQPPHKASPFRKGHVEKKLDSVGTLLAQFVARYTGRSMRGVLHCTPPYALVLTKLPSGQSAPLPQCVCCGAPFTPRQGLRLHCSDACRMVL
ncbi:hypothetical protein GT354_04625 [Streptomyces sp. SID3343]|nr:hypothetical protein [Streptomyces sp. SID3343]